MHHRNSIGIQLTLTQIDRPTIVPEAVLDCDMYQVHGIAINQAPCNNSQYSELTPLLYLCLVSTPVAPLKLRPYSGIEM